MSARRIEPTDPLKRGEIVETSTVNGTTAIKRRSEGMPIVLHIATELYKNINLNALSCLEQAEELLKAYNSKYVEKAAPPAPVDYNIGEQKLDDNTGKTRPKCMFTGEDM